MTGAAATSRPFRVPASPVAVEVNRALNGSLSDSNRSNAVTAAQVQQKHCEERAKRFRSDDTSQFVDLATSERVKHFVDDPWIGLEAPNDGPPALTDGSSCRFLILGARFGGLLFAVRLIQACFDVNDICIVHSAGGSGNKWYWDRYPGLMCDVESYIYM